MLDLPKHHYGAILADPPWRFRTWTETNQQRSPSRYYNLMHTKEIMKIPVSAIARETCVLFIWISWPNLQDALDVISAWGFQYKTCAFAWLKANNRQIDLFDDSLRADLKLGYWTRANSEVCLLATRGKPKRKSGGVRQGIIEPAREHSRKPDCIYDRIEQLVDGPYVELFARQRHPGWRAWGNETEKFNGQIIGRNATERTIRTAKKNNRAAVTAIAE